MTRASIAELVETWRPERCAERNSATLLRYLRASRKEKTRILDEFVAQSFVSRR